MTGSDGSTDRPCGWERTIVQAAALALRRRDDRPAGPGGGDGYRVRATPQPEAVAVDGPDGTALRGLRGGL